MNGNDISRLSYKELQALALRYRVPGNIKKKLLVKVLQAAKGGNENEVGRLLQDLKQTRKKKVRKLKTKRLGLTSTPVQSPEYVMADDYYCPQQQPPYQWVAAEEEIVSRDDDRIPHYEEFKQFLLRRIQRDFQTFDTNNNDLQESSIVDLRTVANASGVQTVQTVSLETNNYAQPNVIAVNNIDSFVSHSNDQMEYQTLEDSHSNAQGSILLKKMLQAPAGANLGEIASPVLGGHRFWPMEQYQSNLLDNSDTLTAESENQDNEDAIRTNTECYSFLSGIKGEYVLNEPAFARNVEAEIGPQISEVFTNDNNANQYRYSSNINTHQNYDNWTITNVIGTAPESNSATSDTQSSKMFQAVYYDNAGTENLNKPTSTHDENMQYRMVETAHNSYGATTTNLLNLNNPTEESQFYESNVIQNVQTESSSSYYLQNLVKYNAEGTGEYFNNIHTVSNNNVEAESYTPCNAQTFPSDSHYNSGLAYDYPYANHEQEDNESTARIAERQHNCKNMEKNESNVESNESPLDRAQTSNGVLDPFWPRKFGKTSTGTVMENILNLYISKHADLTRLDQTSCVYCYIAPIVTHTPVLSSTTCTQKEKFVAEYRQHSFAPHWLLYNDTSCGMRMANFPEKSTETIVEEMNGLHTSTTSSVNLEHREPIEGIEDSINDVWTKHYTNFEVDVEKSTNICEDLNVEDADCLFSVINGQPLVTQVEDINISEAQ